MAVSFLLKVLDFYYFFNAIYYWFYRSYFLMWTVVSCSSEVLLMCDGAAPAPSLLCGCCFTGRAAGGLWARGNWEKARGGLGRDGGGWSRAG